MSPDERVTSSPRSPDPQATAAHGGGGDGPARLHYPYWIPAMGWLLVLVFGYGLVTMGPDDLDYGELWLARAGSVLVILLGIWFVIEGHRFSVFVSDHGLIVRSPFGGQRQIQWREIIELSFGRAMHAVYVRLAGGKQVRVSLLIDGAGLLLHRLHEHTPPAVHGTLFGDIEQHASDVYERMQAPTGVAKLAFFSLNTVLLVMRIASMLPFDPAEVRLRSETVESVLQQVPAPNPAQLPGPARRTPHAVWSAEEALRFREMATVGSFDSIELVLQRLRDDAMADVSSEQRYYDAFASFWDSTTKSGVELWVVERPASIEARLVRAHQLAYLAFERRGTKWARETSRSQFNAMDATLDSALTDARDVLTQDPNALAAYWVLLRAAQTPLPTSRVLPQALRLSPASFVTRARAIMNHLPRWGGSYAEMEQLAGAAQGYLNENPALRSLYGLASWDEATIARRADNDDMAHGLLKESLRYGNAYYPCLEMAKLLYWADRDVEALPYAECAAAERPSMAEVQLYLGHGLYSRGRAGYPANWDAYYPRARQAAYYAYQLDSTDTEIARFWGIARDPFSQARARRQAEQRRTAQ